MKRVLEFLKIPGLIVGCVGAIIVAYKYLESIPKRAEENSQELIEEVKATVKVYSDSTNAHFNKIDKTLEQHGNKLDNVVRSQATLKKIVTTEFAKTMTPEQVLLMMEQFEEAKKNGNTTPIVLQPSEWWIPYDFGLQLNP